MPDIRSSGMKTAMSDRVIEMIVKPICPVKWTPNAGPWIAEVKV
jgi:hypothetical protein